jgi:hypothetical protein
MLISYQANNGQGINIHALVTSVTTYLTNLHTSPNDSRLRQKHEISDKKLMLAYVAVTLMTYI